MLCRPKLWMNHNNVATVLYGESHKLPWQLNKRWSLHNQLALRNVNNNIISREMVSQPHLSFLIWLHSQKQYSSSSFREQGKDLVCCISLTLHDSLQSLIFSVTCGQKKGGKHKTYHRCNCLFKLSTLNYGTPVVRNNDPKFDKIENWSLLNCKWLQKSNWHMSKTDSQM